MASARLQGGSGSAPPSAGGPLVLAPIGVVRSPFLELADAPRQPSAARGTAGRIELAPDRDLGDAIADLETWSHLWVLFWFHRAGGYRPKVLPPRSSGRRGVLATRSPHRPNPIGLSVVRLASIEGLVLHILDVDMVDGTPVLDIKPYLPYVDAVADAGGGWLRPLAEPDPEPGFDVRWSALAGEQLAFLATLGVELQAPVEQRLALGPQPHAYRRIKIVGDRRRLAYKAWRLWFRVDGRTLTVEAIETGYRPRELASSSAAALDTHRRFVERFGGVVAQPG